jgi:hypothetical protein
MAIKTLEARKKQQKLLIVGGVIILVAFLVLYFGFLKNGSSTPETANTIQPGAKTANILLDEKLKKIDLNTDFLIKTILPALKLYGKTPVEKGTTGRTNPFTAQ